MEWNSRALQHETAKERQSRELRERNTERQVCPGRASARVFIWEEVDSYCIWRVGGHSNYDHFWDMYRPTQRQYDGFRDEWDLCSEFDLSAEAQVSDEDNSSDDGYEPQPVDSPLPPILEISVVVDLFRDLANIHDNALAPELNPDIPIETLDEVAYNRFGFKKEYPLPLGMTDLGWDLVHKLLGEGYGMSRQGVLSQEIKQLLSTFFGYLATGKTVADIPGALYDINQTVSDINCLPYNTNISIIGVKTH